MGKKRSRELQGKEVVSKEVDAMKVDDSSSDDEPFDVVNVEFEWFNFNPEIDFHGVKSLLRQLFDVDSALFNLSELADLVLSQPTIGSTVKVDGEETDAYAMMTVLNTHVHREKEPLKAVLSYLCAKASAVPQLQSIPSLLNGDSHVGLVFSERLINVPSEVGPPMYSMLVDEIEAAVEDKEPYEFTHYLILTRAYIEVESTINTEERKQKKPRGASPKAEFFHPEDETFNKAATAFGSFNYTKEEEVAADSKRAFQEMGIQTTGHLILLEASQLNLCIKNMQENAAAS